MQPSWRWNRSATPSRIAARPAGRGHRAPAASRERNVGTAEGNPLFVEQMGAVAVEAGGDPDKLRTPPTIQALLAERLDRLSAPERKLLERASVIGKELPYRALMELSRWTSVTRHRPICSPSSAKTSCGRSVRPQGDMLAVRHDLIRVAAYEAVPEGGPRRSARAVRRLAREKSPGTDQRNSRRSSVTTSSKPPDSVWSWVAWATPRRSWPCVPGRIWPRRVGVRSRGDASAASKLLERAASLLQARPEARAEALLQLGAVAGSGRRGPSRRGPDRGGDACQSAGDERLRMRVEIERSVLRLS